VRVKKPHGNWRKNLAEGSDGTANLTLFRTFLLHNDVFTYNDFAACLFLILKAPGSPKCVLHIVQNKIHISF